MESNRSLDEFARESADADPEDRGDEEQGASTAEPEPAPATATYRWDSTGAPCPRCGETVERRWEDDGEFVCAECKEW